LREGQALNLLPILPSVVFFLSLTAQTQIVCIARFEINSIKKFVLVGSIFLQVVALIINYVYPNPTCFAWAGMVYAFYCLNGITVKIKERNTALHY
jgi:hypothetical protein